MNMNKYGWSLAIGCALIAAAVVAAGVAAAFMMYMFPVRSVRQPVPVATIPAAPQAPRALSLPPPSAAFTDTATVKLTDLYRELTPGVVNIQVLVADSPGGVGMGTGSGFLLDEQGHIITNNHVVAQAAELIVVFYDGSEAKAEIIGLDDDSDLAVIKVEQQPSGVRALPMADSDTVQAGDWAMAIGNPFGLGSSVSLGIVSATGRSIPSGATPFAIPQAIQTDAAINPGNSGGPLLNLAGQVIGVNAQIRTTGAGVNTGVGFAIPSNVVRHIAPVLITRGYYEWPWLGVEGATVNLLLMEANQLDTQFGAYISTVLEGGPADQAGLRGTQQVVTVNGVRTPTGGDVVVEIDGQPVKNFDDLLGEIAFKQPGDEVLLTILRDGQRLQRSVNLEARPRGPGGN
jgi:2-alkenal reductase